MLFFLFSSASAQIDIIEGELESIFEDVNKISGLERKVENLRGNNAAVKREKDKLNKLYNETKNKYVRIENINYRLRIDLKIKDEKIAELENAVYKNEEKLSKLEEERNDLARKLNNLELKILELNERIRLLTDHFVAEIYKLKKIMQERRLESMKRGNSISFDGYNPLKHPDRISKKPKSVSFDMYYYPLPDSKDKIDEEITMEVSFRTRGASPFIVYPVTLYRTIVEEASVSNDLGLEPEDYMYYTNKNPNKACEFTNELEKGVLYHVVLRCKEVEVEIGTFMIN